MAAGTQYTYPEHWRAFKVLNAAQYSGAQVGVLSAPPHFHFGHTNRTPEFLCKFPADKVPAFEGDDRFCVFESSVIACYVSNDELRGSTPEAAAQVVQWVSFADSNIVPPASTWVLPTLAIMRHKQASENAKEEVRRILGLLDLRLKTRTFLVSERVNLAEFTVVYTLFRLHQQVLEPSFRQAFPNTNCWFLTCINQTPLLTCPKLTFVLDGFKRKYSFEDTLSVAPPHFWEHFDKDSCWSLWHAECHFPGELRQTFTSCSLLTGMFQRLDKLRKNAFASVILFGTHNSSSISGKLDPGSEETQTLDREYCWEGAFRHLGKIFK
ncbi:PREDICTED: elongation factor 1-gamma-like [Elephantulus edwardii]|uniref:elongation factor 1-gamma-like n=1 Tax=Elephantulus edwardii TaxID=28737 RepID=UPI0003F0D233|nr:PREDICTED: elongation factor 1-gamma-like [Elephantulus edwardii]